MSWEAEGSGVVSLSFFGVRREVGVGENGRWMEGKVGRREGGELYELGVEFGEARLADVVEDEDGVDHGGQRGERLCGAPAIVLSSVASLRNGRDCHAELLGGFKLRAALPGGSTFFPITATMGRKRGKTIFIQKSIAQIQIRKSSRRCISISDLLN